MKRVALVYDTLEELKNDSDLQVDMFVNTLGKEEIGDGYGQGYTVSDTEKDDSIETVGGLFLVPYKVYSDLKLELEKSLRSDEDNAVKDYIKNTIAELCEDIASEFATKDHSKEGNEETDGNV